MAVTFDPIYSNEDRYYANTQLGEDLVTNPEAHSIPEEIFISKQDSSYIVRSLSNLVPPGQLLMSDDQIRQLKGRLTTIRREFTRLYDPPEGEEFEMEIEFKITSDNVLAIKQARPGCSTNRVRQPRPTRRQLASLSSRARPKRTRLWVSTHANPGRRRHRQPRYSYEWLEDDVAIPEATAETFSTTDDDVGKTIRVRVSFTDNAENGESTTSEGVVITAPPSNDADGPLVEKVCTAGDDAPTPTVVDVLSVPIVVDSTTEDYFVLYVVHAAGVSRTVKQAVAVIKGQDGATTLGENIEALPADRYRVEKYRISDPADIDGDCIDDITELDNMGTMNPVNPMAAINLP